MVAVPFPFVDRPIVKRRPALVLSAENFNAGNGQTVLAMITTGAGSSWPSDIVIGDSDAAGLPHRSVIRWKVFTLPNDALLRKLGSLAGVDREAVRGAARSTLAP
ncbi:MAG TPA: type II toxin-antitoxin system PemK/MazF family toxin [Bauldia sp.]|nr:type II toxin-antitoxin system PemK/MazF family toxin [Bauldia sp.]